MSTERHVTLTCWTLLGLLALALAGCNPCGKLDARICRDLGGDCAAWRANPQIRAIVIPDDEPRGSVRRQQCSVFNDDEMYRTRTLPMVRNQIALLRNPAAPQLPVATGAPPSGTSGDPLMYLLPVVMIAGVIGYSFWRYKATLAAAGARQQGVSAAQAQAQAQMQMQMQQNAYPPPPGGGPFAPPPAGYPAPGPWPQPGANAPQWPGAPPSAPGPYAQPAPPQVPWGSAPPAPAPYVAPQVSAPQGVAPVHPALGRLVSGHAGRMLAGGWTIYVGAILFVSGVASMVTVVPALISGEMDAGTALAGSAAFLIGVLMLGRCVFLWRQTLGIYEGGFELRRMSGAKTIAWSQVAGARAVMVHSRSGSRFELDVALRDGRSVMLTDALAGLQTVSAMFTSRGG